MTYKEQCKNPYPYFSNFLNAFQEKKKLKDSQQSRKEKQLTKNFKNPKQENAIGNGNQNTVIYAFRNS